jgi:hypothetical protein
MSRKKPRSARSNPHVKASSPAKALAAAPEAVTATAPGSSTDKPPLTLVTSQTLNKIQASPDGSLQPREALSPKPGLGRVIRTLGSLKLAVFSLALFAVVLAVGTVVESKWSSKLAMELVYRTWWFTLLLALLATNILCAALKKMDWGNPPRWQWPWKKHQTGFLITHVGLLTLVAGGLLNSFSGTDSLMPLVDSDQVSTQNREGAPQTSNLMIDRDAGLIRVKLPESRKVQEYNFNPGSLPWRPDRYTRGTSNSLLQVLDFLAHPLPRTWSADLDGKARLEIVAFYPFVRVERYSEAGEEADSSRLFPAVKVQLTSPNAGRIPAQWLTPDLEHFTLAGQVSEVGPSMVEVLGKCPSSLLAEFLRPPSANKLGAKGLLVLNWQGRTLPPVSVEEASGKEVPVGNGGLTVKVLAFRQFLRSMERDDQEQQPEDPSVKFRVRTQDGRSATFTVMARLAGALFPEKEDPRAEVDFKGLRVWYHPPDYRYHNSGVNGLLQFVQDEDDGQLYYRSFHSRTGSFLLENAGKVEKNHGAYPIWSGMAWKFLVVDQVRRAMHRNRFVPADLRPGVERSGYAPGVRARLTAGGKSADFWLQQTGNLLVSPDELLTPVTVGGETYRIGYSIQLRELPFELKLLRAEQEVDPGTQSPATYTSYVQMTDKEQNILGQDEVITMNEPLDHRGFKVYQIGYEALGFDANRRPLNRSTFTIGRDPGMSLKYAGTFMLAGGIICMFYMRAYFFKPRGRAPQGTAPVPPPSAKD